MHILVDKNKIIKTVHLEDWDKENLESNTISELLSFEGEPYEQNNLLGYFFVKRLYQNTKHFFIDREGEKTLICWWHSSVFGDKEKEVIIDFSNRLGVFSQKTAVMAMFCSLYNKNNPKLLICSGEDFLHFDLRLNAEPVFVNSFTVPLEKIHDAHKYFQACRNIRDKLTITKIDTWEKIDQIDGIKGSNFVGFNTKNKLEIIPAQDLIIGDNFLKKYIGLSPIITDRKKDRDLTLKAFSHIRVEKNKNKIPSNFDIKLLENAMTTMEITLDGTLDLPPKLQNTLLNYYYQLIVLECDLNIKNKSINNIKEQIKQVKRGFHSHIISLVDAVPGFIKALRMLDKNKHRDKYELMTTKIIDAIKYDIDVRLPRYKVMLQKINKRPLIKEEEGLYKKVYNCL